MSLIESIKEWKNRREKEILQNQMDDNEQPKEVRDRYLESLRREDQYQRNQDEKEYLKKKIANYKKRKMAELLYGIKDKKEKERSYLNADTSRKVQILKEGNNLLRQPSMMHQKSILSNNSLLNNRRDEFKRYKRKR